VIYSRNLKNFIYKLLSLILILDFSLGLNAKEGARRNPIASSPKFFSEESVMREFVEIWNSSKDAHQLLQQFKLKSNEISRIEKDLQKEKIFDQKLPELEYSPVHHVLWMHFEGGQEKILILNRSRPINNERPIVYSGLKFHQIEKKGNFVDTYFKIKTALKQNTNSEKKKKKQVSKLDMLLTAAFVKANAEGVFSVPFTSTGNDKTNWTPWIAIGSVLGLFALWQGYNYFSSKSSAKDSVGDSSKASAGNDAKSVINPNEDQVQPSEAVENQPPPPKQEPQPAVASVEQRVDATSGVVSKDAIPHQVDTAILQPMAEIDKNFKRLEADEHLIVRKLNCSEKEGGTVIVMEKLNSEPLKRFGIYSDRPTEVVIQVKGQMVKSCTYEYADTDKLKLKVGMKDCPEDGDGEMLFSQRDAFKDLRASIIKCCPDSQCRGNLLNLVGAEIERLDPASAPKLKIDNTSVR
jgi:hypothetical protein